MSDDCDLLSSWSEDGDMTIGSSGSGSGLMPEEASAISDAQWRETLAAARACMDNSASANDPKSVAFWRNVVVALMGCVE